MRRLRSFHAGEVAQRLQSSISPVTVVSCFGWFVRMAHAAARIFSAEIVRLFSFTAPNGLMPTFRFRQHHTNLARFLPSQIPAGFISSAGVSLPPRRRGELFLSIHQIPPNSHSPEPTPVLSAMALAEADGAVCHRATGSAGAVHAARRRWPGFLRLGSITRL